ncbi:hypothetical protein [Enterococcus sp. LJL51]|uniref:hypothetical protein n=1 Tax=Enterococcus sp. LJL51 TaxID=3416656 RepID=UPI003CF7A7C3
MEEDWVLRQIKQAVDGLGYLLKRNIETIELGENMSEDGKTIPTYDLILQYLESKRFHDAFLIVDSLKYKLSTYDFNTVSSWFIEYLKAINNGNTSWIDISEIEKYRELLTQLI